MNSMSSAEQLTDELCWLQFWQRRESEVAIAIHKDTFNHNLYKYQ